MVPDFDRRTLLIGGGAGVGLIVAFAAWPRHIGSGLAARNDKEAVLGAFIKIAESGRVTVASPQVETGQGIWTGLAQIVAEELGASWEQMAVEPAPSSPLYANPMMTVAGLKPWMVRETRSRLRITAGSTSIRAFEEPLRTAAAAARALLIGAAATEWGVPAGECDTAAGAVTHEGKRLTFGRLAAAAADRHPPDVDARGPQKQAGEELARLDLPAKSDGSLRFAADVRLPGMVFASLRMAPPQGRLTGFSENAARQVAGVRKVVATDDWLAVIAETWSTAERALVAAQPRFTGPGDAGNRQVTAAMRAALDGNDGDLLFERGDYAAAVAGARPLTATYSIAPAQHLGIEPLCATARFTGDRLEVWAPTQAPEFARAAAAKGAGLSARSVTLYPMPVGSRSGRALEADAVPIAVMLAANAGRPVQLTIPHDVGTNHDVLRPPLLARLAALPAPGGGLAAWSSRMVTAPGLEGVLARFAGASRPTTDLAAGIIPYGVPVLRIERVPVELPVRTGYLLGGFEGMAGFATESFMDELAKAQGAEPLAFRIGLLGGNVRLAKVLMAAATIGGWDGGAGGKGLACATAFGSHIGVLAEAHIGPDQRVVVDRLVAAVDCGRAINPGLVRQQIESGLIAALDNATAAAPEFVAGMPRARPRRGLGLVELGTAPKIEVELIPSAETPGGVSGLGSTVLAGAVANAIASAGHRLRNLPFDLRAGA